MTTTLLTGDLHLNLKPHDRNRHEFMAETLPDLILEYCVSQLIIVGDLTDAKDRHPSVLVNQIVDHLYQLTTMVNIIVLKGNHDGKDELWPFFRFVRRIPYIRWINKPRLIGSDLFLPHTVDWERDWKDVPMKKARRIFTHVTFQGALGENGQELEGVPIQTLPSVEVFSGDVHVPQQLDNVTYVGAPYRIKFGDRFAPRVLILGKGKPQSVPVNGPQKQLLHFTWPNLPDASYSPGDTIKVRVNIDSKDEFPVIKSKIENWCRKHDYRLHSVTPILQQEGPVRVRHIRSDQELIRDYASAKNLDRKTLQVGLDISEQT